MASSRPHLILTVACCVLGCLLPAGHSLGVINTPEQVIRSWITTGLNARGYGVSDVTEVALWATVVSVYIAGAAVGATLAPAMLDRMGRKKSVLLIAVLNSVSCFSFLLCMTVNAVELLLIGRIIAGIATGLSNCAVSLFLSEVCPADLKGVFSAVVPMGFTIGMLVAYIAGLPCLLGDPTLWPVLLALPLLYCAAAMLIIKWVPESPVYICTKIDPSNFNSAKQFRNLSDADRINGGNWSLMSIVRSTDLRSLLALVMILNIGQQFSGVNSIFYYSMLVFRSAGLDDREASIATLFIFIANTVMAVAALVLLRKFSRRSLLSFSCVGAIVCLTSLVASLNMLETDSQTNLKAHNTTVVDFVTTQATNDKLDHRLKSSFGEEMFVEAHFHHDFQSTTEFETTTSRPDGGGSQPAAVVAMVAMVVFIVFYGVGLGPIPYSYGAEMFPTGPRSAALAAGAMANWSSNFIVGLTFPLLQMWLQYYVFLVYVAALALLLLVVLWCMPEPPLSDDSEEIVKERLMDANGTATNTPPHQV